jgi:hypothetical protein
MIVPTFGDVQASSASFFSQADSPLAPAFSLYERFSAAVQRKCTCLVLRSLAGKGGLPRFLGCVMGRIMVYTNSSCNPSLGMI